MKQYVEEGKAIIEESLVKSLDPSANVEMLKKEAEDLENINRMK